MACLVCSHHEHEALLAALPTQSLRALEVQYGISRSALQRHRQQGCPAGPQRGGTAANGDLAQVLARLGAIETLLTTLVAQALKPHDGGDTTHHEGEQPVWNRL